MIGRAGTHPGLSGPVSPWLPIWGTQCGFHWIAHPQRVSGHTDGEPASLLISLHRWPGTYASQGPPYSHSSWWSRNRGKILASLAESRIFPGSFQVSVSPVCAQLLWSCLNLCDPMDGSPPGSSVHGILQAIILEQVAIPSSKGSSWPRNQTGVSCIAGRFFTSWAIKKAPQVDNIIFKTLRTRVPSKFNSSKNFVS